jgi:hypothetical protein
MIGRVLSAVIGIPSSTDRALLSTMCLASLADGTATKLELGHAREIALEMPGFRRKSREELQEELEEALSEVERVAPEQVMRGIAEVLDDEQTREQAFALAAVVIYVDLHKRAEETAFLRSFRDALEIPEARARAILTEIEAEVDAIRRGDEPAPGT